MKPLCALFMLCSLAGAARAQLAPDQAAPAQQQAPQPQPAQYEHWDGFNGPDFYLTAADNWKVASTYFAPIGSRPVVVMLHAIGRGKGDWRPLASELARRGIGYLGIDLRGHGGSCLDVTGSTTSWKNFRHTGMDNEFNQMSRDMEAGMDFLKAHGVDENRVIVAGAGLGANLAIKLAAMHPQLMMAALLAPSLNATRDVLSVNPLHSYGKRPIFIVAPTDEVRAYEEVKIIKAIADIVAGSSRVTFITEPKGPSWKLLNKSVLNALLQWIKTPQMPPVIVPSTATVSGLSPDTTAQEPEDSTNADPQLQE